MSTPQLTYGGMKIPRLIGRAAAAVAVSSMIVLSGPTQGALAAPVGAGSFAAAPKPPGAVVITVIGVVVDDTEFGCRTLAVSGGGSYLLLGAGSVPSGVTVRVTGEVRPDILTTCQRGTVLLASSVTPV